MKNLQYSFPDDSFLQYALVSVLDKNDFYSSKLKVSERITNVYESTFPSEIVRCKIGDGTALKFLIKYDADCDRNTYNPRGGIEYEGKIYRDILTLMNVPVVKYYGMYRDIKNEYSFIVIQYLDNAMHAREDLLAMNDAVQWLARFHAEGESLISLKRASFLKRYDFDYYMGWARRTSEYTGYLHADNPWLPRFCRQFKEVIEYLLYEPQTVVHGEFYPANILYQDGIIYPVDWESAALAAGEIDLATITDRWPPEEIQKWENMYRKIRWPDGAPEHFLKRLCVSRLYLEFRWLGDRPEWARRTSIIQRINKIYKLGIELGFNP